MLEIESQVIDKTKASKSDHEYRVNNSPDFNTYLKLAYELKSIEEMAKKKKSEMAPFETKVREDALHLMEDRKDFENFKWVDAKKIGEVTVILADRFPSINDEICTIVKEYGYKEGDFFDAEYIVDNAVVLECPEIMQDIPLDPFSDQPFIYKVNQDGTIMLYSVGENLKDDGGDQKQYNDIVIAPLKKTATTDEHR